MTIKERISNIRRKAQRTVTTDNCVDLGVDILIVVFDVLTSPILIAMRIIRWCIRKWIIKHIKSFIKWFLHKVCRIDNTPLDWND